MPPFYYDQPMQFPGTIIPDAIKHTLLLTGLVGLSLPLHAEVHTDIYVDLDIFGYSETVPIANAIDQWNGPFTSGTDVFSHDRVELGAGHGSWDLGLFKRYDYELKFSESTSEFYYRINNKLALDPGRVYDLDIVIRHTYSEGVRLIYANSVNKRLGYKLGVSYLHGIELTDGYIKGTANARSESDYDFQFDVSYVYSEDTLFDRIVAAPDGEGVGLDLDVDWQINDKLDTHVSIRDLYSVIRWYNAPYTTAVASSDTKTYDENNYVVYKPVISGVEKNRDFKQRIPTRAELRMDYSVAQQMSVVVAYNINKNFNYYQLGLDYDVGPHSYLNAMYIPALESVSISYHSEMFRIAFISDTLNMSQARSLGLGIAFAWAW